MSPKNRVVLLDRPCRRMLADPRSPAAQKVLRPLACSAGSPGDLEKLRGYSRNFPPRMTLWAVLRFDDRGRITEVDSPSNVLIAGELLNDPSRVLPDISGNLESYIPKLPDPWRVGTISGGKSVANFAAALRKLSEVKSGEAIVDAYGPELSWLLFDSIAVIQHVHLMTAGNPAEKAQARQFVAEFHDMADAYLRNMTTALKRPPGTADGIAHGLDLLQQLVRRSTTALAK